MLVLNPMPALSLLSNQHILSSSSFSPQILNLILNTALSMERAFLHKEIPPLLQGFILATLFFEPSTRTRLSFESAMMRLGGQVVSVSDHLSTSLCKGESLSDTAKIVSQYADLLIVRHPKAFSVHEMSKFSDVPVINAGDGTNEHPTQALLDLYTIFRQEQLKPGMTIGFLGDLYHGRTVHSLVALLKHYDMRMVFIADPDIAMPKELIASLNPAQVIQTEEMAAVLPELDVLYVTRIQEERFENKALYAKLVSSYQVTMELLHQSKESLSIMHPLPRVMELDPLIDQSKKAVYFKQAQNGLFVRMALLALVANKISPDFLEKWS